DTPAVTCGASTGFAAVANVPYVVAAIASVPSFVFFELIRLQDQAFAPIEDLAYSRLGFAGQFNAMIKAIENASRSDVDPATSNYARRVTQYVEQCASEAVNFDPDKNNNISSPLEFVLDSISPDKLDLPNSGASTPMVMLGVPSVTNCAEGYANLTSDIQPFAQKVFERAQANVPGACKVSLASNSQAFADTMASNVQSALMGNTNPIMNALASAALIDPVAKGRKNDQLGLDAGSGSSIYNSLATNMAIVQMQQEGVGRFQWMSEMIPIGLHIALPYAYAMSMFVLMLTLYTNSLMYLSNYVKGILSLESVRFGMALSHNFVSMYAQHRAFDLLAGYSENMFALNTMPVYLNYMATMAGVSGLIGVSLAIATPILIFRGDPAALLGAISGLAGRFNNRAQDINQAHDDAMSKQRAAEAYLKQHGVPLEGGMGAVQQAERLRQQIDRSGEAFGSLEASQNLRDYEQGRMIESANRVGSTLGLGGSDTSVGQGMGAGKVSGRTSGITMQETSGMLNNQEYFQGVRGGVAQSLGSTQGMGAEMAKREMSMGDMRSLGHAMGAEKLGASVADYNAKRLSGQITQNNTLSDQAFTGFERESRLKSEALMGVGAATSPLQQAWEQIRRQSAGQFSERFESAAGYVDRAMDGNGLKGGYAEAVKGASAAKIASMIGATSVFGGADAQADFAQKESALKTAQSIGSLEGTVKELRETGKDFVSAAKEMSSMLAGAKTAGDLVSIKTAEEKGGGYIKLAKDSAEVTTKQKAGSVLSAKLVEDNTESQQKLIDKIVDGARAIGGENKASEAIRSFQNAGLLDENGKVREGSWIRGKAFLSGLNMGGLNAMSIAGITTTAALNLEGGDPTIRMSALNSSEYGETSKFSNKVKEINTTDTVTDIFVEATNGDMEKAASLRRAYNASKTGLDPKNWLAGVTAFLTDGADDTQSLLAAGVIGVGGSIALVEIAQSTKNLAQGNYID
ncbi:MAG: conjugal transfer protein TraG N-terminal domain-containing protein, partial [Wolinella sp.]